MSDTEKMEVDTEFSVHSEDLGSDPCMDGESSKQCTPPPHEKDVSRPLEKNKNKEISSSAPLPPRKPCLPIFATIAEARLSLPFEQAVEYELEHGRRKPVPNMDPKKLRRTVSNRISAHRSRVKKVQQILDMEKIVQELEEKISGQKQQIDSIQKEKELLLQENNVLQNQMETLSREAKQSEEELEKKKAEIKELQALERMVNPRLNLTLRPHQTPYPTLNFYQEGLQKLQEASSSTAVKPKLQIIPNFSSENNEIDMTQRVEFNQLNEEVVTVEDDDVEVPDVDHYLNLDELNISNLLG